jgi:chromosome segregation ATPase
MDKIKSWLDEFKTWIASEVVKLKEAQSAADSARAELSAAKQEILSLTTAKTDLETAAKSHADTVTAKDAEIAKLKTEKEAAENKATEAIAGQSLSPDQLPAGSTENNSMKTDAKIAAIREKIKSSQDPKEKYVLSEEIKALVAKSKN